VLSLVDGGDAPTVPGYHEETLARDPERLARAAAEVGRGAAAEPITVAGDVRDETALRRAVDETVAARGRLDIVVNNAGGPPRGTFAETDPALWPDAFELTVNSALRLTRLALPHLARSGRGRIVNITSWSVREPIGNLMLSNAMRPAVAGWAKALAREVGPQGITVNTIAPGKIETDRARELWQASEDPEGAKRADEEMIPLRRIGSPDEIAAVVAFLCSIPGGYVSGVVLPVDGGLLRGSW